jgi:prepilin-type N-terminal cleavage/methylation domain-containing protein
MITTPAGTGQTGSEAGFTLVELMLSMIILVVGILAMTGTMASMTRYQDLSAARTDMTTLADNKLEQLRAAATTRSTDTLQLALGGDLVNPAALHVDTLVERGRTYVRLWTVAAGLGGTRDVTLRIRPLTDDARTPAQIDFRTQVLVLTSVGGIE